MTMILPSIPLEEGQDRGLPQAGTAEAGDIWRILWCRRAWIIGTIGVCLAAALVYDIVTPSQYTATAELFIDPRDREITMKDVNPNGLAPDGGLLLIESQSRVVESDTVLLRAVSAAGLDQDPDYGAPGRTFFGRIVGAVIGLFDGSVEADGPTAAQYRALRVLRRHLAVKRADKVFVVDVVVTSWTAEKAARIADAIAEAYLADQVAAHAQSSLRASQALAARLAELRDAVVEAAGKVEQYKADHNIVGTERQLVTDQQLDDSGRKLADARAKTIEMRGRVNQIDALRRSGGDNGAMAEAIQSTVITQLRASLGTLQRQETDLRTRVGDRHPDLVAVIAQVAETRRQIDSELTRLARSAHADYDRALADERALASALDKSKANTLTSDSASVELRELIRELDARRGLYQSFLARAAETREQADVDTTNARIISKAIPPNKPSWPLRAFILLGAIGGGFGLGAGLAFVLEYVTPTILSIRHLQRVVAVPVIGVLRARGRRAWPFARPPRPAAATSEAPVDPAIGLAIGRLAGPLGALRTAREPYSLVLTSTRGDGAARTDAAERLVATAADCHVDVLLVEADLTMTNSPGAEPRDTGFLDMLRGECGFSRATGLHGSGGVRRLGLGNARADAAEEINEDRIVGFINKAGRFFDLIVFDTGAFESNLRLAPLLARADAVVIVAVKGETALRDAGRAADVIATAAGRPLSGALLFDAARA